MEDSIRDRIRKKIASGKKGMIYFPSDFMEYGNVESVKKALFRLEESGFLKRLAHGIYLYPKNDKLLGVLYPSMEEIASVIAKRDKARIMPTGVHALNKLGLSTQVPTKVVYLTDGSPRSIKVGKRSLNFTKTTPKNLSTKGEISSLVIQGLREIGQGHLTKQDLSRIKDLLSKEKPELIKYDASLAPAWIREIMLENLS